MRSAPVSTASDWTARVLVGGLKPARAYWYRFTDETATAAASAAPSPRRRERSATGELRVRELPGRQRRQTERLSPDDLRRRTRRPGRPARLRAPPRRLHLRGGRVSRRDKDPLRPHDLRSRAHPGRHEGRQLPHSARPSMAIAPSTKAISPIPTSRTPARAGRSSQSGTTTSSRG